MEKSVKSLFGTAKHYKVKVKKKKLKIKKQRVALGLPSVLFLIVNLICGKIEKNDEERKIWPDFLWSRRD